MKIDLPRARVAPVPETPFLFLFPFLLLLFPFPLTHCSHDLFVLSICPWAREHRTTFPLLRATLHSTPPQHNIHTHTVDVYVLGDFSPFFLVLLLPIPVLLLGQTNDDERTSKRTRTNDGAEKRRANERASEREKARERRRRRRRERS